MLRKVLLVMALLPVTVFAQATVDIKGNNTLLTVRGSGEVKSIPTSAAFNVGASSVAADTVTAQQETAKKGNAIIDTLKREGVADKDIKTTRISLSPAYREFPNNEREREFIGFRANNSVQVKINDLERVGPIMDALVKSGATNINGPYFETNRSEGQYREARALAMKHADDQARDYAKSAGLKILRIATIADSNAPGYVANFGSRSVGTVTVAGSRVMPGESSVNANVIVQYELGR